MNLYLIRHTTPMVEPSVCYGQSDVGVTEQFDLEAATVHGKLPDLAGIPVYASPLDRCRRLAAFLSDQPPRIDARLMEMHFGDWEGRRWADIDPVALRHWGDHYVTEGPPNGEAMQTLHERCTHFYAELLTAGHADVLVVTHGGVIRTLLCHVLALPLDRAFTFHLDFAGVTQILVQDGVSKIMGVNR